MLLSFSANEYGEYRVNICKWKSLKSKMNGFSNYKRLKKVYVKRAST